MAVGDKQRLITDIVATVLNEAAQTDRSFNWFINKHTKINLIVLAIHFYFCIVTLHDLR